MSPRPPRRPNAPDPKSLIPIIERAAGPGRPLTFRPMFGGAMGYEEGRPFALLSRSGVLALKLGAADRDALIAAGGTPFRFGHSRPSEKYVVVPSDMLTDQAGLAPWVERSLAFASVSPSAPKRASSARSKRPR